MSDSTPIDEVLEAFGAGRVVAMVDDLADRGTGGLLVAAESTGADAVNYLATHGRGLVCLGIPVERARALGLEQQAENAQTAYTVSIEATTGVTTGISAADRARTVEVAIDPASGPDDVVSPGHLFPVVVHAGGVLVNRSIPEAAVDLARLADCSHPAGVYCQVLDEDGEEATVEQVSQLARQLGLPLLTMSDLVRYRTLRERLVRQVESGSLDTSWGTFEVTVWENLLDGGHHLLLSRGEVVSPAGEPAPLVRVHSQCLTGDAFKSQRCDCGRQLDAAFAAIKEAGRGAILYLRQEGRGIGLVAKLKAYMLQDKGRDTVEANVELGFQPDMRDYAVGAQILRAAGYKRLRLLTNNPRKIKGLKAHGLDVEARVALQVDPEPANLRYLQAKKDKLGHLLEGF